MPTYTLYDFLKYPNFGFKLTLMTPFAWLKDGTKRRKDVVFENPLHAIWWLFATVNLFYHIFGLLVHFFTVRRATADANEMERVDEIFQLLGVLFFQMASFSKIGTLYRSRARITALLQELLLLFPSAATQRQRLTAGAASYRTHHFATASHRQMKRTAVFYTSLLVYYIMLPVMQLLYELAMPELHPKYEYHSKTWYPWQSFHMEHNSPANFVAGFVCQMAAFVASMSFIMANEFLFFFFITQMRLHFDNLARALAALDARSPDANSQLRQLIQYHNRLLRLSNEINDVFNPAFMVNLTSSSVAICLTSLSIISMKPMRTLKYCPGFLMFVIVNFFLCYNGHLITKASDELMPAAFYGNWYEGDWTYRRMILFFVMRTGRPHILRVYNYANVSMATYMAILKLSYQLFTFFRAIN